MSELEKLAEVLENLTITSKSDSQIPEKIEPKIDKNETDPPTSEMSFKIEYLHCVPEFDGSANELNRFLSTSESLIKKNYDDTKPADDFANVYLLNCLIGKLSGNAKLVVNIQNVNTWADLKEVLTRNFSDQRDETCLNQDLVMMRQLPYEKPQQFYDRVLNILNLLCNYVDMHENNANAKNLKRNLYNNLALKTFLSGLKEPVATTIRCMKPTTLTEALQFVSEEDNIKYFQNLTGRNTPQAQYQFQKQLKSNVPQFQTHLNHNNSPQFQPIRNFQSQGFQKFPSQPINMQSKPIQQKFPTNAQVFGRQPSNVFKPNPNQKFQKPTPMSTSTTNTYRPQQMITNIKPQITSSHQRIGTSYLKNFSM